MVRRKYLANSDVFDFEIIFEFLVSYKRNKIVIRKLKIKAIVCLFYSFPSLPGLWFTEIKFNVKSVRSFDTLSKLAYDTLQLVNYSTAKEKIEFKSIELN